MSKIFLRKEVATPCDHCSDHQTEQHWKETNKEILLVTKNIKKEIESRKTVTDKISQAITDFCGSMFFIYFHFVFFSSWIFFNLYSDFVFDPYPFGLLTLTVSLEAIILATFILIAQNKQSEVTDIRSELDYQVDRHSEKKATEIYELLDKVYKEIIKDKK